MSGEYVPNGWMPSDDEPEQPFASTQAKGELIPPPRKPPTAIGAAASEPEPRPPRPARGWRPAAPDLPRPFSQAVNAVFDVLDSIADAVRSWGARRI
jgi:hypothetical protein